MITTIRKFVLRHCSLISFGLCIFLIFFVTFGPHIFSRPSADFAPFAILIVSSLAFSLITYR